MRKIYSFLLIVLSFSLVSSCKDPETVGPPVSLGPFTQQGSKLTLPNSGLPAFFGSSVAISGDGKTALIASPSYNNGQGAAFVYIKSGNTWIQQGSRLFGSDAIKAPFPGGYVPGYPVALSYDGNVAVIGDPDDNGTHGAIWVFTRQGNVWKQQGNKLVGTGAVAKTSDPSFIGKSIQGFSVAISADGNTIIEGGMFDYDPIYDNNAGAAWVFVRSGDTWVQQGEKLVAQEDNYTYGHQGSALALSADGNTAVIGANSHDGTTRVFTRQNGKWTQQGGKLVGSGAIRDNYYGGVHQGSSVAISASGNTIVIGGDGDSLGVGAVWTFEKMGNAWVEQGGKLTSPSALAGVDNGARQGCSVAISADGNTLLVGGYKDNQGKGACWAYTRRGNSWVALGEKLVANDGVSIDRDGVSPGQPGIGIHQGCAVALSADGSTAIIGGNYDNYYKGAAWIFHR